MITIAIVTGARSDYGIYLPVLKQIQTDTNWSIHLIVSGMHLSPEFGLTIESIEKDGFLICDRIEMLLSSSSVEGLSKSIGLGVIGFAQSYSHLRPDLLMVLGDRIEMLAAVIASLSYKIPVAHIHGGESTEGAIDEAIRHSITKMSHLHFAATEVYAQRIIQMGEEPWRVVVSGAPSLDNLKTLTFLEPVELEQQYNLDLALPFLLVTYHPVTLEYEQTEQQMQELLTALHQVQYPVIFTYPNADTKSYIILEMIRDFARQYNWARILPNLGTQGYFSLMKYAKAMVGNSSSGIIEAASFKLPVVNIGNRQKGRIHGNNVINCGYNHVEIIEAINRAVSFEFKANLADLVNPYGDGGASERIVNQLKKTEINEQLLIKHFYNLNIMP